MAIHPLSIVHMSDQYTRISSGGSPLKTNAPVVGLLFGLSDDSSSTNSEDRYIQILDADDISIDVSDSSTIQVELHLAVFPKHKVVGWYRVSDENEEPTPDDLEITTKLKERYTSAGGFFCFCLLKVKSTPDSNDRKMSNATAYDTLSKDLPINLYEIQKIDDRFPVLLGLSNWELETSPSERIAIERVMKERPVELDCDATVADNNPFVIECKTMQHSLISMKERVHVLVKYLDDVQSRMMPADPSVLRQIQQIVSSIGPLSKFAARSNEGEEEDVQILAHLALVARTVNAIQCYTEKIRIVRESRDIRRPF